MKNVSRASFTFSSIWERDMIYWFARYSPNTRDFVGKKSKVGVSRVLGRLDCWTRKKRKEQLILISGLALEDIAKEAKVSRLFPSVVFQMARSVRDSEQTMTFPSSPSRRYTLVVNKNDKKWEKTEKNIHTMDRSETRRGFAKCFRNGIIQLIKSSRHYPNLMMLRLYY